MMWKVYFKYKQFTFKLKSCTNNILKLASDIFEIIAQPAFIF